MKHFTIFLILLSQLLLSQKRTYEKADSVSYYLDLVKFNKQENNYKNCLIFSQKAIDYAQKTNNQRAIADSYSNLGTILLELKKNDDAIDVLIKSVAVYSTLPFSSEQAFTHYTLGVCYMQTGNFSMAENNFNTAEVIYKKLKIPSAIEMLNLQKAIIYIENKRYDSAIPILESIVSKQDANDFYKTKAEALLQLAKIEIEKKRYNLAISYLNKALELNNKNLDQKLSIISALSEAYEKSMNVEKAHIYLKKFISLKDSSSNINNKNLGLEDFKTYKNSEKLKRISQIDKENKAQQKANTFAKLISILAIALISILSLLSLSLYKNNIIRTQSNTLLKEKNRELQIAKENAENATKARLEFLSTVSHELRTPLNAINGITHLLIEEDPKESQRDYLDSLKFSGNYLLNFINDILEINRIESDNVPIEKINCDLRLLFLNIQNSFKEITLENNNTFSIYIDDGIPETILCDPTKISQIFINLVNNSLKFTKNGNVKLTAKLKTIQDKNIEIYFKVSDNGIGIADEQQASIFDSFSQGSIEINRKYGGTGLGLAIVKRLVELLGGDIKLISKIGLGTTFSFTLPFGIGEKIVVTPKDTTYNEKSIKNKKILLVEDNKINQMITKKMIENKGMICQIVDNGEAAVEILKLDNDFDLVLMDVHLPGINGTIATQQIREFDEDIKIIALTAISLNENRDMLLSYGMNDVITKPFEPEKFYTVIAENLA